MFNKRETGIGATVGGSVKNSRVKPQLHRSPLSESLFTDHLLPFPLSLFIVHRPLKRKKVPQDSLSLRQDAVSFSRASLSPGILRTGIKRRLLASTTSQYGGHLVTGRIFVTHPLLSHRPDRPLRNSTRGVEKDLRNGKKGSREIVESGIK